MTEQSRGVKTQTSWKVLFVAELKLHIYKAQTRKYGYGLQWRLTLTATSSLLSRLSQKWQEQWEEAVNSIDFSHSSPKPWSTINKLTGRSGRSSRLCPVSPNSTVSQLVKNEAHKQESRVLLACQLGVWLMEGPNTLALSRKRSLLTTSTAGARKIIEITFYFLRVYTTLWISSQILIMRFLHLLCEPTRFPGSGQER